MGISEILKLEQENAQIILHKEGLFVRVYERSAFLFIKHIKEYSLTKKFYKNVKQEVIYLGFPQSSYSKIENICKAKNLEVKEENNQITIKGLEKFTEMEFVNWKAEITLIESKGVAQSTRSHTLKEIDLIKKIKSFNVANKTPIECQQFIVELQNQLNG